MTSVLIVAAHPDDELLGVGATAARHAAQGDEVHCLILGEGATSRGEGGKALDDLRRAGAEASRIVGANEPRFSEFPDNKLDTVPLLEVVQAIEEVMSSIHPNIIYTHASCDLNIDHRITHYAVRTAGRPLPGSRITEIYAFETLSSTEWGPRPFAPNHFVDITGFLEAKIDALACYEGEMRSFPHPRSPEAVRALAAYRGATIGVTAAEAFEVVRVARIADQQAK